MSDDLTYIYKNVIIYFIRKQAIPLLDFYNYRESEIKLQQTVPHRYLRNKHLINDVDKTGKR